MSKLSNKATVAFGNKSDSILKNKNQEVLSSLDLYLVDYQFIRFISNLAAKTELLCDLTTTHSLFEGELKR